MKNRCFELRRGEFGVPDYSNEGRIGINGFAKQQPNKCMKRQRSKSPAPLKIVFMDVAPANWPADLGTIAPETFRQCGFALGTLLDQRSGLISLFNAEILPDFCRALRNADLVVGYNCLSFDRNIIAGAGGRIGSVRWLDLMEQIFRATNRSVPLSALLEVNFGIHSGVSLRKHRRWIKEQNRIQLAAKCINGVVGMLRIYHWVCQQGKLRIPSEEKKSEEIPIAWQPIN